MVVFNSLILVYGPIVRQPTLCPRNCSSIGSGYTTVTHECNIENCLQPPPTAIYNGSLMNNGFLPNVATACNPLLFYK